MWAVLLWIVLPVAARVVDGPSARGGGSNQLHHTSSVADVSSSTTDLRQQHRQQRQRRLEERLDEQAALLAAQSGRIADLERVAPKEFEVVHYNVLSDQAGTNLQPWFCYGADLTPAERKLLHDNFYAKGKDYKSQPRKGWPEWAEGG